MAENVGSSDIWSDGVEKKRKLPNTDATSDAPAAKKATFSTAKKPASAETKESISPNINLYQQKRSLTPYEWATLSIFVRELPREVYYTQL